MGTEHIRAVVDLVPTRVPPGQRFVIAIAGPPASGKSTIAAQLRSALGSRAAVLGMDAFHFDNQVLEDRGDLARKGAPHTFDVDGYANALLRLRSEPSQVIAIPEFDRSLELTRNAAHVVSAEQDIVITEGNYLLLDHDPWAALGPLFDLTVWLDVPQATIERRITERWLGHGFNAADAADRLARNDLPNAQLVQDHNRTADISITNADG